LAGEDWVRKRCKCCGRPLSRSGRCKSVKGIPSASQIVCVMRMREQAGVAVDYWLMGDGSLALSEVGR
jgi:hypothetical protein